MPIAHCSRLLFPSRAAVETHSHPPNRPQPGRTVALALARVGPAVCQMFCIRVNRHIHTRVAFQFDCVALTLIGYNTRRHLCRYDLHSSSILRTPNVDCKRRISLFDGISPPISTHTHTSFIAYSDRNGNRVQHDGHAAVYVLNVVKHFTQTHLAPGTHFSVH